MTITDDFVCPSYSQKPNDKQCTMTVTEKYVLYLLWYIKTPIDNTCGVWCQDGEEVCKSVRLSVACTWGSAGKFQVFDENTLSCCGEILRDILNSKAFINLMGCIKSIGNSNAGIHLCSIPSIFYIILLNKQPGPCLHMDWY